MYGVQALPGLGAAVVSHARGPVAATAASVLRRHISSSKPCAKLVTDNRVDERQFTEIQRVCCQDTSHELLNIFNAFMCIYAFIYLHTRTHINTHIYSQTRASPHPHVCTQACVHASSVRVCTSLSARLYTNEHMRTFESTEFGHTRVRTSRTGDMCGLAFGAQRTRINVLFQTSTIHTCTYTPQVRTNPGYSRILPSQPWHWSIYVLSLTCTRTDHTCA